MNTTRSPGGRRVRRLRSAVRGVGTRPARAEWPGDPELLALVAASYSDASG